MTAGEWDLPAMRCLAAMPFLDRLELAVITGMSEGTAHYVLGRLRGAGLADSIRHAAPLPRPPAAGGSPPEAWAGPPGDGGRHQR